MTKKIWKNLEFKIALLVVFIVALLTFIVYSIVYNQYYNLTIDKLKEDAYIVYRYAEDAIDARTFIELNTREDEESELYRAAYEQLDEIRRIANIMFLYTAKRNADGDYIYIVDGLNRDDDEFRHVGDPIENEIVSQLSQSLNNEVVFGDRIINAEWGIVYVVYFPFHDSAGNVIGAIGMEFDCEYLYISFNRMRALTIVVSSLLTLAFITIAYFVIKRLVRGTRVAFAKMDETRRRMQLDLRRAEERTKLMLDSSPICTQIWDREINTIDCNEAAVKLYRFKDKQEYVEKFVSECSPEFQPDGQRSDEKALALVRKVFTEGYWSGEWMHRIPADDTLLPSEVTLVRVNYGDDYVVLGYTRDLREHVKMMQDIEKQQRILYEEHENQKILLDMLPIGIRIMRIPDGAMLYANEAALKLFGCDSFEEMMSGAGRMFLPKVQPGGIDTADLVAELYRKPGYTVELQCLKLNGEPFIARFSSLKINYKGAPASLAAVEDVTEEKEYQQSLRNIAQKEQEASKAKSVFLAKMSHEIRTPMNAIIGMSELALRESEPDTMKEHVHTIKQASSNLLAIINDILDFSKIETGKLEILPVSYSVSSIINDVVSIIRMRLVDSAVRFIVNADRNIPGMLFGDDKKIRQALINVLGNAVKYTDKGFISFSVFSEAIDEDTVNLVMEIKDSGRGIKQDDIGKLFKDFVQLSHEANADVEGVGLGLAITKSIVAAMGGDISVESEYGKGSAFTITLPQKFSSRKAMATVENPENKNVLLYERRDTYAKSVIDTMENLGVNCIHIMNTSELYEKLTGGSFDFLFISFHLFKQNEDIIMKYRGDTKLAVFTEFGETVMETIPGNELNVLAMPVYSVPVADMLNSVSGKFSHDANHDPIVSFTAPDAKVLIVDDIRTNLIVARGLLLPYGIQAEICNSGQAALDAIASKDFDLVFMDHKMPDMDGVEATLKIREMGLDDPYYRELPIVALTANAVAGMREMYLENGFNDFLSKPIDTAELNTVLEKWLPEKLRVEGDGS